MESLNKYLEDFYYQKASANNVINHEDIFRRGKIKQIFGERYYTRTLHIGCQDGFITESLPSWERYGLGCPEDKFDTLPNSVQGIIEPRGEYDLVVVLDLMHHDKNQYSSEYVVNGVMYYDYYHKHIYEMVMKYSNYHIMIAGNKDLLYPYNYKSEILSEMEIPYQNGFQKMTLYQKSK